jgi:hypothetical protein
MAPDARGRRGRAKPATQPGPYAIGPDQRGWYAVNIIAREGHDLLGQFVVTGDAQVKRNQTDRIFKAIVVLHRGVRQLETSTTLARRSPGATCSGPDSMSPRSPRRCCCSGRASSSPHRAGN